MISTKITNQIRIRTPVDDSSSVSSMSSLSRRYKCHVCKEPETLPTKPLVRCMVCKGSWHPGCHRPSIDDPKKVNFRCTKCLRKLNTTSADSVLSTPTSGHIRADNGGSSTSQPDGWAARRICQKQDCEAPVYQSRLNSTRLCKRHEMEERHKRATAQKQAASAAVLPLPKPIHKKKLYPVKPDTSMRVLKRKRPSYCKDSDNDVQMSMATTSNIPQDPSSRPITQGSSNNLSTQDRTSVMWPPPPTVEDAQDSEFLIDASCSELGIIKQTSRAEESAADGSGNSQITMENGTDDNEDLLRTNESPNNDPEPTLTKNSENHEVPTHTPLKTPPIPLHQETVKEAHDGVGRLDEEEATPGQVDVDMPDCPNNASTIQLHDNLTFGVERGRRKIGRSPKRSREPLSISQHEVSIATAEKAEIVSEAKVAEDDNHQVVDKIRVPKPPVLTLVSLSTTSGEDIISEHPSAVETDTRLSSLLAQQQQNTESFDPSSLDSWLEKQAQYEMDSQFTAQELIETQIWGHIDPRTIWPKEPTPDWLDQKREEIEARGGRKANFGKLLTQQVIKERKEQGWKIHQNKNVVDDEKSEDAAKALQELFGIKDIDDLEPGVRDGQLVMVKKADDEERPRKKSAVYMVG